MKRTMGNDERRKWVTCFNSKFEEFINDLISLYDDMNFKTVKSSFNMMKVVDENKPYQLFSKYGSKYKEYVQTRNEMFFLNYDYLDEINKTDITIDKDNCTNIITIIKGYWYDMNDSNKEIIWKYLEILYKLLDKINSI